MQDESIIQPYTVRVISLTGSERRDLIRPQLQAANIQYEFFDAIDGDRLTETQLCIYDDASTVANLGRSLTHREIGNALSHRHLYQQMIESNDQFMLVLEDDALLPKDFHELLCDAVSNAKDYDLLSFFSGSGHLLRQNKITIGNSRFYRASTYVSGAVGYLITQGAARRLVQKPLVTHVADWPRCVTNIAFYVAYPNVVGHNFDIPSTLEQGRFDARQSRGVANWLPYGTLRRIVSSVARLCHLKWFLLHKRYPSYRLYVEKDVKPIIKSLLPFVYIRRAPLIVRDRKC